MIQRMQELMAKCPVNWHIAVTILADEVGVELFYFGQERSFDIRTFGYGFPELKALVHIEDALLTAQRVHQKILESDRKHDETQKN